MIFGFGFATRFAGRFLFGFGGKVTGGLLGPMLHNDYSVVS